MRTTSTMIAFCCCGLSAILMAHCAAGEIQICPSKQHVTTDVGGTAVLSCRIWHGTSTDNLSVVWKKTTGGAEDIVVHNQNVGNTSNNQGAAYLHRTAMYEDWFSRRDATLNVTGIGAEDAGEYSCCIIRGPPSLTTMYSCCTTTLDVREWKGDIKQVVVVWSLYIISLAGCVFVLHRCRRQTADPDEKP
ncbi:CD276 antigen-like [Hyla sarda]|uniref:CD276 antigen-like n=1 Tax=Hyla sarda TaxID=327740 RepID=UPI0024C2AA33|nr:CD276 antigen-like [Hyla sarda]XP_056379313.1 CD276 antigen-like [Hyla sarda]